MKKKSVRDLWVYKSWHYRGAGFEKNKKKILDRKGKYKNNDYEDSCNRK